MHIISLLGSSNALSLISSIGIDTFGHLKRGWFTAVPSWRIFLSSSVMFFSAVAQSIYFESIYVTCCICSIPDCIAGLTSRLLCFSVDKKIVYIISTPLTKTSTSSSRSAKSSRLGNYSAKRSTFRIYCAKSSTFGIFSANSSTFGIFSTKSITLGIFSAKKHVWDFILEK